MRSVYIASTEGSGGKTMLSLGLALALRARGLSVGYFKPVGVVPVEDDPDAGDQDARFVAHVLGLSEPLSDLCPVLLDEGDVHEVLGGADVDAMVRIGQAYERVRAGKDILVCEGLGEIWQGRFLRTSGLDIVAALDLQALLVARFAGARLLDDICYVNDALKRRLLGVVFTMVPESRVDLVTGEYAAFLNSQGIASFGALRADSRLSAVTVAEIVQAVGGSYLSGEEHSDTLVESYLIGAMSPEHARHYFEQTPGKAVVVGGDRAEIILAALETSTAALVLTGGHIPSPAVLGRAQELGVPVVSVAGDTVAAADAIRRAFGHLGVHEPRKVDLIAGIVAAAVDVDKLLAALGASLEG